MSGSPPTGWGASRASPPCHHCSLNPGLGRPLTHCDCPVPISLSSLWSTPLCLTYFQQILDGGLHTEEVPDPFGLALKDGSKGCW